MLSTAVLMAASLAVGQVKEPVSHYEQLKSFDALIGCWSMDGVTLEDIPDGPPKGAKMTVHSSYKWMLNKNAIQIHGLVKIAGLPDTEFVQLISWNSATEQIIRRGVSAGGFIDDACCEIGAGGKAWTWKIQQVTPDGESEDRTVVLTLKNEGTLVWQELDRSGPLTGDSPKYEVKRCKEEHPDDDG